MELGSTTLHYLAVWQAVVSVHRPVRSKITGLPGKLAAVHPGEWLQGAIKHQGGPFPIKFSLCAC